MKLSLVLTCFSLGACGLVAGIEGVPPPPEGGASGSGSASSSSHSDASGGDAGDAIVVPPGSIQCGTTPETCQLTGGQGCCVALYGSTTTGSPVYDYSMGSCAMNPIAICSEWGNAGYTFMDNFAQTCATAADCDAGFCCGQVGDAAAGSAPKVGPITCASESVCATTGQIVCKTDGDCPSGTTCIAEADPLLVHVWTHRCSQ